MCGGGGCSDGVCVRVCACVCAHTLPLRYDKQACVFHVLFENISLPAYA